MPNPHDRRRERDKQIHDNREHNKKLDVVQVVLPVSNTPTVANVAVVTTNTVTANVQTTNTVDSAPLTPAVLPISNT